jgi:hypothetical protein
VLKILSPTVHGALDYALALAFLFLPGVLGFPNLAANTSQLIGLLYLGVSLLTRYPLGALKLIPFPAHGVLESIMAASWIVLPWVLGFDEHASARSFFVAAGIGLLAVVLLTDYQVAMRAVPSRDDRRHGGIDRRRHEIVVAVDRRFGTPDRRAYARGLMT